MLFVGIDIGGTFTDLALYDSGQTRSCASTRCARRPTTRAARSSTASASCASWRTSGTGDIDGVLHGTTVATNAVLEHRGASDRPGHDRRACATWCTSAAISGPQPYSVMQDIPWQSRPFVQRQHRIGVPERIAPPAGETVIELDEEAVREAGRDAARRRASRRWPSASCSPT